MGYFLAPVGSSQALGEVFSAPRCASGFVGRAVFALVMAAGWHYGSIAGPQHIGAVFFTALAALYARAICVEISTPLAEQGELYRPGFAFKAYIALVASVVFGAQILGLMDLSAPASPFSSLRVHGGSNHLILPTGVLQTWAYTSPKMSESAFFRNSFGGGLVRIEYTDSVWLNSLYPSEITAAIPSEIVAVLRRGGHIGRQFNPTPHRWVPS